MTGAGESRATFSMANPATANEDTAQPAHALHSPTMSDDNQGSGFPLRRE